MRGGVRSEEREKDRVEKEKPQASALPVLPFMADNIGQQADSEAPPKRRRLVLCLSKTYSCAFAEAF